MKQIGVKNPTVYCSKSVTCFQSCSHLPAHRATCLQQKLLRGHPYITSAYFGPFWNPPTHLISINAVLNVSKNGHFLDPPTQSLCWRNIGMATYLYLLFFLLLILEMKWNCPQKSIRNQLCLLIPRAFWTRKT